MNSVIVKNNSVDTFVGMQNTKATRGAYSWALRVWFDWLDGRTIDTDVVIEYRDWLAGKMKPRSAAQVYTITRLFYRFINITPNPFDTIKPPKRIRNITPSVPADNLVDDILDLCDSTRDRLILLLLLNGLRASEVGNLKRENITWHPEYNRDIIKVVGKGSKERLVPASHEASKALRSWDKQHGDSAFLFGPAPLTLRQVEYAVEKWSRKAGKEFRPHKLRHHYATRLARNGVNPFVLKELLGHEDISTTMIYVRMDISDAVNEVTKDPIDYVKVEEGER